MSTYNWIKPRDLPPGAEILSVCCSMPFWHEAPGICSACRDHTGFMAYDEDGNELGDVDMGDMV